MTGSQILKTSNLSITSGRLEILRVLVEARLPLSEKEIEKSMISGCNRTTVYRNLTTLADKGIIHRVLAEGVVKYKYISDNGHEHVHFKCRGCKQVTCLHEIPVQDYSLPEGFIGKENQFLVVGVCKQCNQK
jgi:Fur family transcriptional regulator, ferric uptake regulator